jgi:hypothetical protein
MTLHWQLWLKRSWIVSSPETFSADRLYLVLNPSHLHSLLIFLTQMAALVALWINLTFWVTRQWALTVALFVSLAHRVQG